MRSRRWLPIAIAAVILVASLVPGGGGGGAVAGIGIDKLLHTGGYAVLAAAALAARRRVDARSVLVVGLLVTAFGGVVELLQAPVPGRSLSALDLAADAVGAAAGVTAWWLFTWISRTEADDAWP